MLRLEAKRGSKTRGLPRGPQTRGFVGSQERGDGPQTGGFPRLKGGFPDQGFSRLSPWGLPMTPFKTLYFLPAGPRSVTKVPLVLLY